ncbi:MAG: NBR1-Ig-like domain-containing protein [Oscillospiraceae bacterium]
MIHIEFSRYCGNIYPICSDVQSQGMFVSKLFAAGGSTSFSTTASSDKEYQKKLCNGSKPLTQKLKSSFPRDLNQDTVSDLLKKHIKAEKVRDVMTAFAIPISAKEDISILAKALAEQFRLLIESVENDVDDIVAAEYQRLLSNPTAMGIATTPKTPLYTDDNAWVLDFIPERRYTLKCYDEFQYTWHIRNNGKQIWRGRKFCFINSTEVRPRTSENCINIPDVSPGQDIKIAANFDARGFEGLFNCIWEMQDIDGNNCFPNDKNLFVITLNVEFE